jgi:hypothetical protein
MTNREMLKSVMRDVLGDYYTDAKGDAMLALRFPDCPQLDQQLPEAEGKRLLAEFSRERSGILNWMLPLVSSVSRGATMEGGYKR